MAYNLYEEPKIDWDTSKGVTDADFNRVEGNELALLSNQKNNELINGGFDVWQRGLLQSISTGGTTRQFFLADRWFRYLDGTDTVGQDERVGFVAGQTNVPGNPTYAYRSKVTAQAGGMTMNTLMQSIENVRRFSGKQVTISFFAAATTAKTLRVCMSQNFGTGGSAAYWSDNVDVALTTAWQKFTVTLTLPSISGKTIGSDGTHYTGLHFTFPKNETYQIELAKVKLEFGPVATPLVFKGYMEEFNDCLRYYEALSTNQCVFAAGFNISVYGGLAQIMYRPKRVTPTVVTTNALFQALFNNETGATITDVSVNNIGDASALIHFTVSGGGLVQGDGNLLLGTGGFIAVDAELV